MFCFSVTRQQSSIPLEKFQIEELIQRLDRDGTGMVDYRCDLSKLDFHDDVIDHEL